MTVREARDAVGVVGGTDRDGTRDARGVADRVGQALVAGGDDRGDADGAELIDRRLDRVGVTRARRGESTDTHVHGRDLIRVAQVIDVLEPKDPVRGKGQRAGILPAGAERRAVDPREDLDRNDGGVRRDSRRVECVARRDSGHVRAVPAPDGRVGAGRGCARPGLRRLAVGTTAEPREAGLVHDPSAEERMGRVDSRIQDRHGHAAPGVTGVLRGGKADDRTAVHEGGGNRIVSGHAHDGRRSDESIERGGVDRRDDDRERAGAGGDATVRPDEARDGVLIGANRGPLAAACGSGERAFAAEVRCGSDDDSLARQGGAGVERCRGGGGWTSVPRGGVGRSRAGFIVGCARRAHTRRRRAGAGHARERRHVRDEVPHEDVGGPIRVARNEVRGIRLKRDVPAVPGHTRMAARSVGLAARRTDTDANDVIVHVADKNIGNAIGVTGHEIGGGGGVREHGPGSVECGLHARSIGLAPRRCHRASLDHGTTREHDEDHRHCAISHLCLPCPNRSISIEGRRVVRYESFGL